jgi:hypothetical protein
VENFIAIILIKSASYKTIDFGFEKPGRARKLDLRGEDEKMKTRWG